METLKKYNKSELSPSKKLYEYTLLKQDGTSEYLGVSKQKTLKELYKILECSTIEVIPVDYYKSRKHGRRCTMWGDEEGRYKEGNTTNPHFDVLSPGWDVVGNILKEQRYYPEKKIR